MLRRIFQFLNRDLSGRTWQIESTHPYFGKIIRFCSKRGTGDYWEAELTALKSPKPFSVTLRGTTEGPTEAEVAFCRSIVSDLDSAFAKCRDSFAPKFEALTKSPLPRVWGDAFVLDGIDIPIDGDPNGIWSICYSVAPARRYFTAHFESGKVVDVVADG